MLSKQRITEICLTCQTVEQAVRLAVAETVEACAAVCDDKAKKYAGKGLYPNEMASLHCAAAIREKAREGK